MIRKIDEIIQVELLAIEIYKQEGYNQWRLEGPESRMRFRKVAYKLLVEHRTQKNEGELDA